MHRSGNFELIIFKYTTRIFRLGAVFAPARRGCCPARRIKTRKSRLFNEFHGHVSGLCALFCPVSLFQRPSASRPPPPGRRSAVPGPKGPPPPQVSQVIGHRTQPKPHFVGTEAMATEAGNMELHLRHHAPRYLPTRCLVQKALVADHWFVARPSHWPRPQFRNVPLRLQRVPIQGPVYGSSPRGFLECFQPALFLDAGYKPV